MSVTPPPIPFSEGGPPQSEKSPGDQSRELIHEVRNLAQAVGLLNQTYVRKEDFDRRAKVIYIIAGVAAVAVFLAFGSLFWSQHVHTRQEDTLVNKLVGNCQTRNGSTVTTDNLINGLLGIVTEEAQHVSNPSSLYTKIEQQYITLLTNYEKSQPKQVDCQHIRP